MFALIRVNWLLMDANILDAPLLSPVGGQREREISRKHAAAKICRPAREIELSNLGAGPFLCAVPPHPPAEKIICPTRRCWRRDARKCENSSEGRALRRFRSAVSFSLLNIRTRSAMP